MVILVCRLACRPVPLALAVNALLWTSMAFWLAPRRPANLKSFATLKPSATATVSPNTGNKGVEAEVFHRIQDSFYSAAALQPKQQYAFALEQAAHLERIGSVGSMVEIGQLVQKRMGTTVRSYAPASTRPAGEFDFSDALIHSVVRKKNAAGRMAAYYVMVDRVGRSFEVEAPDGEALSVQVFERLQQSPVLSHLKDEILLPLVGQRLQTSQK